MEVDVSQYPPMSRLQFFLWNRDYLEAGFQVGERVEFEVRNCRLTGKSTPTSLFSLPPAQRFLAAGKKAAVWSEPPDVNVLPERELRPGLGTQPGVIPLEAAANDYVDFQVAVRAQVDLRQVHVTVGLPRVATTNVSFSSESVLVRPVGLVKTAATAPTPPARRSPADR